MVKPKIAKQQPTEQPPKARRLDADVIRRECFGWLTEEEQEELEIEKEAEQRREILRLEDELLARGCDSGIFELAKEKMVGADDNEALIQLYQRALRKCDELLAAHEASCAGSMAGGRSLPCSASIGR